MKREDLKRSFEKVEPSQAARQRMLDHILQESEKARKTKPKRSFNPRRAIPVMAMTLLVAAGIAVWGLSLGTPLTGNTGEIRLNAADSTEHGAAEDNVAILKDQFQLGNRHYIVLHDHQRVEFGLPDSISDEDIGDKLATISTSVDESLMGLEVYRYAPAGGEAIVAVKKNSGYQLFRFLAFVSYMNNQDEDARAYLELYGIYSADDIARILFIGHSEQAKIEGRMDILAELTDRQKIEEFYEYYSVIPNSSDRYFDKLFNYTRIDDGYVDVNPDPVNPESGETVVHPVPPEYRDGVFYDIPVSPDTPVDAVPDPTKPMSVKTSPDYTEDLVNHMLVESVDSGAVHHGASVGSSDHVRPADSGAVHHGGTMSSQGRAGTRALENALTIRIYNKKGIYMEATYYTNIGFISRHEVNDEFEAFLRDCLGQ